MKRLSKEQMKKVNGGTAFGTCSADCPSGQSAVCIGYDSCVYNKDSNGNETGVTCTSGGVVKTINCAQTTIGPAN